MGAPVKQTRVAVDCGCDNRLGTLTFTDAERMFVNSIQGFLDALDNASRRLHVTTYAVGRWRLEAHCNRCGGDFRPVLPTVRYALAVELGNPPVKDRGLLVLGYDGSVTSAYPLADMNKRLERA